MERGKRLLGIGEACAERGLAIGAKDTQVPQREVLEVHLGLAEVEIEQEFDWPRAVESDEFPGAAVLRGRREGDLFEIIVDELGFGPRLADVFATSRLCCGEEDVFGNTREEPSVVYFTDRPGMADHHQIRRRLLDIVDLGVLEQGPIEYRTTPIDHADQQASGISRKALKSRYESVMIHPKNGFVRSLHEPEHFGEVVEIIVDGQLRQFSQADLRGRNRLFYFCSKGVGEVKRLDGLQLQWLPTARCVHPHYLEPRVGR